MADTKLIGHDYQTPGTLAKVTGQAKYAEDFRAEGMLFCKLLLSPMPHARVRNIDAREALRMPGVRGLLTADDLPPLPEPPAPLDAAPSPYPSLKLEMALTNEPVYEGEPILAVAADDELTAANAIEKIVVDLEPLPFCVDPIQSLHPDGPNARLEGNVYIGPRVVPDHGQHAEVDPGGLARGRGRAAAVPRWNEHLADRRRRRGFSKRRP